MNGIQILPIKNIGEIKKGDDLSSVIIKHFKLRDYDVLVVTQKVVSKAEGRIVKVDLNDLENQREKIILSEATRVLRKRGDLIITETHHGFICASSGVDFSNVEHGYCALLPKDPDKSAKTLMIKLKHKLGLSHLGVIISDTFGRPWRKGLTDVAIGAAGIRVIKDYRGKRDKYKNLMRATEICIADELASAGELVMGKFDEVPCAVIRGIGPELFVDSRAKSIIRKPKEDLFR
jgi:coenzyme F420-0:L-glutamate ligase/coenzyme F420-1:gamma-L-glutamate ligase